MLAQEIFSAIAFAYLIGLVCLANYLTHHISVEVFTTENEIFHPDSFIAGRSYGDLATLTDFGPRATGSDANELHAVNFLLRRANEIRLNHANVSDISVDLQQVNGVNNGYAYYRNIQNVVVKLQGVADRAVMINCHFDSEAGSYGAGDDGVNCCTMLEILRVMAKSGRRNDYSTIFLFNGNEEGNLEGIQASHGFITQHKWAKDVRAFINLEAQGIGGRELLFRTGPKHNWLVTKYRQSVPKPFGQVFCEEMFETNVLKSGTDFESFRDAGNVPGLDISYAHEGWKYHTKFDHIRYVDLESIQNTGNNILELIKLMANSDEIGNPPEGTAAVYFDLWGLVFVSYTIAVGKIINITLSLLAVAVPFLVQTKLKVKNVANVLKETLLSFATFSIGIILSMLASFGLGLFMNATDNAMFWHNSMILSLGTYSALSLLVLLVVYHVLNSLADRFCRRNYKDNSKHHKRNDLQSQLNGISLFWAVLTIITTSFGLRSGYILMVVLAISLITNLLIYLFSRIPGLKTRVHSWIVVHFLGHSFSLLWMAYLILAQWKIFIPISEKTFSANPETTISLICALFPVVMFSYFIPITSLVKSRAILYMTLTATFIISVILAFTSTGFPYSGSLAEPRVQRHYITHTRRTFFDSDGEVRYTDVGFFIKENERNTKRTLDWILDRERLIPKDEDVMCATEAFCGFPSYNKTNAFWMKAFDYPNVVKSQLSLTSKLEEGRTVELSFDLVGSLLTLIYVSPEIGAEIELNDIGFRSTEWIEGRRALFLKIVYGKATSDPFKFTIKLRKTDSMGNTLLKVTVVTIDSHFDRSPMAPEFQQLYNKFPSYTFVQTHQADVSSYTF